MTKAYNLLVLQPRSADEGAAMGAQGRHLGTPPHTTADTPETL